MSPSPPTTAATAPRLHLRVTLSRAGDDAPRLLVATRGVVRAYDLDALTHRRRLSPSEGRKEEQREQDMGTHCPVRRYDQPHRLPPGELCGYASDDPDDPPSQTHRELRTRARSCRRIHS